METPIPFILLALKGKSDFIAELIKVGMKLIGLESSDEIPPIDTSKDPSPGEVSQKIREAFSTFKK